MASILRDENSLFPFALSQRGFFANTFVNESIFHVHKVRER